MLPFLTLLLFIKTLTSKNKNVNFQMQEKSELYDDLSCVHRSELIALGCQCWYNGWIHGSYQKNDFAANGIPKKKVKKWTVHVKMCEVHVLRSTRLTKRWALTQNLEKGTWRNEIFVEHLFYNGILFVSFRRYPYIQIWINVNHDIQYFALDNSTDYVHSTVWGDGNASVDRWRDGS